MTRSIVLLAFALTSICHADVLLQKVAGDPLIYVGHVGPNDTAGAFNHLGHLDPAQAKRVHRQLVITEYRQIAVMSLMHTTYAPMPNPLTLTYPALAKAAAQLQNLIDAPAGEERLAEPLPQSDEIWPFFRKALGIDVPLSPS